MAIYMHPAAATPLHSGEDFSIEETDELRACAKPASDRTLVPVEDLALLIKNGARLRRLESAHFAMVGRRPDMRAGR